MGAILSIRPSAIRIVSVLVSLLGTENKGNVPNFILQEMLPMSSPTLNQGIFIGGTQRAIHQIETQSFIEPEFDPVLTARAMVAVTLLGSGFWYVIWKTALHFMAGH